MEQEKDLKTLKIIGGIGSLLPFFSFFLKIGPLLGLVSSLLILFAMKELAEISGRREIFKNYLLYFILSLGVIAIIFLGFFGVLGVIGPGILLGAGKKAFLSALFKGGFVLVASFIAAWILGIVASYFLKKSFHEVASVFGVNIFEVTGWIIFLGAILVIVIIGAFLVFPLGNILMAVSFFSLPERFIQKGENQTQ